MAVNKGAGEEEAAVSSWTCTNEELIEILWTDFNPAFAARVWTLAARLIIRKSTCHFETHCHYQL